MRAIRYDDKDGTLTTKAILLFQSAMRAIRYDGESPNRTPDKLRFQSAMRAIRYDSGDSN